MGVDGGSTVIVVVTSPLTMIGISSTGIQGATCTPIEICPVDRETKNGSMPGPRETAPSVMVTSRTGPLVPIMCPPRTSSSNAPTSRLVRERGQGMLGGAGTCRRTPGCADSRPVPVRASANHCSPFRLARSPATATRTRARDSGASPLARRGHDLLTSQSMLRLPAEFPGLRSSTSAAKPAPGVMGVRGS